MNFQCFLTILINLRYNKDTKNGRGEKRKMKKKILAILLATLMTATMFACIPSVSSEEESLLAEQKNHVTPEQWADIEELLAQNKGSRSLPDLEIIEFDMKDDVLWADIYNSGNAYAHAFDVRFHVYYDSEWKACGRDIVWLGLMIGNTVWTNSQEVVYSGYLNSRAWADMYNDLAESDDTNNAETAYFTFS